VKAAVYLRVSTDRQDELAQEPDCLRLCGARSWEPVLYREVESGAKKRPVWDALKNDVRIGKVGAVVFWALDRTGRTRVQVAHDLGEVFRHGAQVASVKDAWLDMPPGPMRDLLVQVMAWVAEGERSRLIERTNAGLVRAKAKGVKLGRKFLAPELVGAIRVQWALGRNPYQAAKEIEVKQSTIRTYYARFKAAKGCATKGGENAVRKTAKNQGGEGAS
jgi:putative DNA-invertase from lambdoid prophage Rac